MEIWAIAHQISAAKEKYVSEKQNLEWAQQVKMNLKCGSQGMKSK